MSKCIICMAVYDTDDNKRTEYTEYTLNSLFDTVDFHIHKLFIGDNNSCGKTKKLLKKYQNNHGVTIRYNSENKGTAGAINDGIRLREKGDYAIKIDNDVVIHDLNWVEKMIRCFENDPKLGVLGLKRKDLPNQPGSIEFPSKELKFLPHKLGEPWSIIETCDDIIGTCHMYNPLLLDKVGYLYQPGLYAFDDCLMCLRSLIAGFYNAFYPSVEIEHLDEGKVPYTEWKRNYAGMYMKEFEKIKEGYINNPDTIYYNPFE